MNAEKHVAWLEERRKGIGGSDVAPILGISPWKTPLAVWKDKTGKNPLVSNETPAMYWGSTLEEVVAKEFAKRTSKNVQRRNQSFVHPDYPVLRANIDRYITGEKAILECKTSNSFAKNEWGESGSKDIPMFYLTQVIHYMTVTGYKKSYIAVLIGGNDFRTYEQDYDKELADMISEKCLEFWENYVVKDIPPPPTNLEEVQEMYQKSIPESIVASSKVEEAWKSIKEIKDMQKKLDAKAKETEFIIKEYLKDNEELLDLQGKVIATWKTSVSKRLDSKALKAANPDLYEQFTKESISRRFLVK